VVPPPPVAGGVGVAGAVAPTLAVTVACWLVVRTVIARPLSLVVTSDEARFPAVVENETGAAVSGFPLISRTVAVMVVDPPVFGTEAGFALIATLPTEAVPTAIFSAPFEPVDAPPESALIVAVPFARPARNF